jgi:hypothetical protein
MFLEASSPAISVSNLEFAFDDDWLPKKRLLSKKRPHVPFASISMQSESSRHPASQRASDGQGPAFELAAATAAAQPKAPSSAPQWRVAAGNLAAGATAGCAVEAALYPIDTIKTRLQAMRSGGGLRALLQAGGGRSLYAGVWGNLAGVAPSSAIFIAVYESVKRVVSGCECVAVWCVCGGHAFVFIYFSFRIGMSLGGLHGMKISQDQTTSHTLYAGRTPLCAPFRDHGWSKALTEPGASPSPPPPFPPHTRPAPRPPQPWTRTASSWPPSWAAWLPALPPALYACPPRW